MTTLYTLHPILLSLIFFWLHGTGSITAQTILDTQDAKYQIAQTYFEALKENKFNCLKPYVVSKQQILQSFEQQNRVISGKKAKKMRGQLLEQCYRQFRQARQQAIQQGIDWKKTNFQSCEYSDQQLFNLRFFFTYEQQTYWIALEIYQYNFSNQFFLRENISSQFEKQLVQLPYQSDNNSIPDSLFLLPVGNIDSLYALVQKQDELTPTTELTDLIANTDIFLDSLVSEINTFPLASTQTSLVRELMLQQGNANKIKTHFTALNHFVSSEFSNITLAQDDFHLIEVGHENWGNYLFDGRSTIATKVLLLKWKKDLRYFESRVLALWLKDE